ncbi:MULTISPECIES: glycosyltransferase [Mesorhizobium]|uniref:Glycosyltransferase n=1 Tax=Mesorhizobium denitrificans TaxID=2294114 RepID=A0A371XGE0_9HYPH|nr:MULTISPECIES: glycosyltransferase [Mesorhizobium]RFC68295.1 glycosyltransferase [Mesorhizobium denitrificans]
MSTIGLNMIVKNEAKIILNCLASVRSLVDYVLIVDTGSTDGTQDLIRNFLQQAGIAGKVIEEPWRNFADNRTSALNALRQISGVDYTLLMDADDLLVLEPDFDPKSFKSSLSADIYDLKIVHGDIYFFRPALFRNALNFSFKAVLHEYLEAPPEAKSRQTANGIYIKTTAGGARSANPDKYKDDAKLLENALETETDPFLISRYTFYLAQSYRDCGERELALKNYLRRAEMGYWDQEVYVSRWEAANLMAALGRPFDDVVAAYETAIKIVPERAEAFHSASRYCRNQRHFKKGFEFAKRALGFQQPAGLFVQPWVYDYALLDEYAVNGYWADSYYESLDACLKLLESDKTPQDMRKRVAANARFAFEKLPKP